MVVLCTLEWNKWLLSACHVCKTRSKVIWFELTPQHHSQPRLYGMKTTSHDIDFNLCFVIEKCLENPKRESVERLFGCVCESAIYDDGIFVMASNRIERFSGEELLLFNVAYHRRVYQEAVNTEHFDNRDTLENARAQQYPAEDISTWSAYNLLNTESRPKTLGDTPSLIPITVMS